MRHSDEKSLGRRVGARDSGQGRRQSTAQSPSNSVAVARGAEPDERSVRETLQEYGRGIVGGLLFSLPMLYTMEMWWAGLSMHPWRILAGLLSTGVLLLGYNRYAGLRRDASFVEVAIDSVEELGIGLLLTTIVLWLIGRVTPDMPVSEIVGKIVIEALIVAIGVSVGTAQLGGESDEGMVGDTDGVDLVGQTVLAFCGAVLIASNVAPTEEIIVLAVEMSGWQLLGLALVSLALNALILFYSGFRVARRLTSADGLVAMIIGSVVTYAVALVVSALLLWFFGSFDGYAPSTWLGETVVLGVAAALGASAGRLLLQANPGN